MFFFNKIGHAGTLDPIAEGLLIVLLNKAVKLSQYFLSLDKEYVTRIRLGITTDTYDLDGNIIGKSLVPRIDDDYLAGLIKSFKGFYKQKIPVLPLIFI
jgi:tRNA pseudouridine55 synthase